MILERRYVNGYIVLLVDGYAQGRRQFRVTIEFPNGRFFMGSEFYKNRPYAERAYKKLLSKLWDKVA